MNNKTYQTILKTTNDKGNTIIICYDPLLCNGYNIFIDDNKLVEHNIQFYCDALVYVYKELHGFEELRVLFKNYGLIEDDFIYILDLLECGMDKAIIKHEKGEIGIYDYTKKDKAWIFLSVNKDDYKILNKVVDNTDFDDLYMESKESLLDSIKDSKDWLEEIDFDIYSHTKIDI
jgi:hypothetical protein